MIGILVDNIKNDSKNYILFRELNELSKHIDCYIFTDKIDSLPIQNKFAILQQIHSLEHSGILIGTSIINAQVVAKSLMAKEKYYYIYDFDWIYIQNYYNSQLQLTLYNKDINLISRSNDHDKLIQKITNRKSKAIIHNWNHNDIRSKICQNFLH